MAGTKKKRRRNFRAARLRRKLRLRHAFLDRGGRHGVSCYQCDLPDDVSEHAAEIPAGHPSPEAQEKAPPETGAVFSDDARPKDDEGHDHEHSAT